MTDFNRWRRLVTPEGDAPPTWLRRTVSLFWDNLGALVLLNLAGTGLAVPVIVVGPVLGFGGLLIALGVTLPLLLGGLLAAVSGEWRERPGPMRHHAVAALRARWLPLIALGLIGALAGGASLTTTAQVLAGTSGTFFFLWIAQSAVLVFLVTLLLYALPLAATRDLGPRLALRNALVLAIAAPLPTVAVLALAVLLLILLLWFGLGLWLIVPVILATVLTANCEAQLARLLPPDNPA